MEKIYRNEKHCFLCENRHLDLQKGLICSLTNSKREIKIKCPDFEFRLDKRIILRDFNAEIEKPEHQKVNIIGSAIKWVLIGIFLLGIGYYTFASIYEMGWIYTLPIGIMLSGLGLIPYGVGVYLTGMQALKILDKKQVEYNYFFNLYEI